MHHGTCVTHVPWCMSGSLNRGGGENAPGIPGACATHNITYLARGPSQRHSDTQLYHRIRGINLRLGSPLWRHQSHSLLFIPHDDNVQTWDTCVCPSVVSQSTARIDTYREINLFIPSLYWWIICNIRADSRFAPSKWETSLQSNAVSHWLGANLESTL